ncbi:GldG family protein [Paenibacillus sp. 481]|nr:GldG family protein [Paenibacillus sp. 481]UHA75854.1 GldG family protein [Paenibacillus sp. 481]
MNKWLRGTNAALLSVAVVGIFVLLTYFLQSLTGFQWDLTKNQSFTLSDQTTTTLSQLNGKVDMKLFVTPQDDPILTRQVADMAQQYAKHNKNITFSQYDLLKEPSLAQQYELSGSSLVLEQGEKRNTVGLYEMFSAGEGYGAYAFSGEQKMTQALRSLTSDKKTKVYALNGHQEFPLAQMSALQSSFLQENIELQPLNIYQAGSIPADADMIMIAGAQQDISEQEYQLLKKYVEGNGKLYIALGYNPDMKQQWKQMDKLLQVVGVNNRHAIAVEPKKSLLNDPYTIVTNYSSHELTSKLAQYNLVTMLSLGVPLEAKQQEGFVVEPILTTSEQAYGETDLKKMSEQGSEQDAKDLTGPLNLGYAVQTADGKPKAVVVGGASYLHNSMIMTQGNRDFALNSVNWLQGDKDQLTIRPREHEAYQVAYLTPAQGQAILWTTVIGAPLFLLAVGGGIWWRRRRAQ